MNHIVTTKQPGIWNNLLKKQANADIYFTAEYHDSYETSMRRQGTAFYYESGGESFFYPFMLSEIGNVGRHSLSKKYRDIETVYGYSGPQATTDDPDFLSEVYNKFHEYCADQNIVCALLRFHPLLENHKIKSAQTNLLLNRRTVSIDLENADNLWKNYHPKLRNDLRKAENLDLQVKENSMDLQDFAHFYECTMKRLEAPEFYIFDNSHYDFYKNQKRARLFSVHKDGKFIAGSIFIFGDKWMHYHLSANAGSEYQSYASKLILHKAALWGIDNGYKQFHLGGGRTPEIDDNLLFFKKRFSNDLHDFYIGKNIIDEAVYAELCNSWLSQANYEPLPWLQIYRLPVSQAVQRDVIPIKVAS